MKYVSRQITTTFLLSAAMTLGSVTAQQAAKPWTVAVYLNADHNLDSSAIADLEEMASAGNGTLDNVRVVYYLDRSDDAEDADTGVEMGIIEKGERRVVRTLPEQNSDSPKVLTDFVTWAYKTYPSQKRGLILWDHGGQWDGGFGGDEYGPGIVDKETKSMTLRDTASAVDTALNTLGINQLEFLSFDTCLMGGAEILAEFAPLTQLFIADAEIDFGDGWDYKNTFEYLNANPTATMQAFGKAQVAFWDQHHLAGGGEEDRTKRTNAAFDTTLWPATEAALDAFAADLTTLLTNPQERAALLKARTEAYEYGFNSDEDKPGTRQAYIDLGHFARRVAQATSDSRLKASATTLAAALDRMTIAKSIGDKIPGASAFSIYLPLKGKLPENVNTSLIEYAKLELNKTAWQGFQAKWMSTIQGTTPALAFKDISVARKGAAYQIDFTPSGTYLDAVLINLYAVRGNLTTDYGDLYYQRAEPGQSTFTWTPTIWTLGDGTTAVPVTADRDEPGSPLYTSAALYTPPGEQDGFDIILRFNETGRVVGVLDTSGIAPVGINLKAGGTLRLYTRTYKGTDERPTETLSGTPLKLGSSGLSSLTAKRAPLPAGQYQLAFSVFDQLGNEDGEAVDLN
ncbi:clostripain-related cysteine peptidase [Deinococcus sp. UR1]|uniref:clostripain-related cysteine peptidase n=1 Tax=Deinococcus sp. UR1 TaxID=1704277 RepID=UPI000C176D87|nr:clostripain-related cysteine peptidase [Deinococcus sp. UR1]PIG97458.1 hypothetical protein AMD26_012915 [Deinococcus sp. UR1]